MVSVCGDVAADATTPLGRVATSSLGSSTRPRAPPSHALPLLEPVLVVRIYRGEPSVSAGQGQCGCQGCDGSARRAGRSGPYRQSAVARALRQIRGADLPRAGTRRRLRDRPPAHPVTWTPAWPRAAGSSPSSGTRSSAWVGCPGSARRGGPAAGRLSPSQGGIGGRVRHGRVPADGAQPSPADSDRPPGRP